MDIVFDKVNRWWNIFVVSNEKHIHKNSKYLILMLSKTAWENEGLVCEMNVLNLQLYFDF